MEDAPPAAAAAAAPEAAPPPPPPAAAAAAEPVPVKQEDEQQQQQEEPVASAAVSDGAVQQNGDPAPEQQPAEAEVASVSDDEVKQRLMVLLGKSDLTQTTEKMLRKQLEQELQQDLSSKKKLIRQEVVAYLEQHQAAEEEEEEQPAEEEEPLPKAGKKRGGGGGFGGECVLSEALAQFVGAERMARTQVVKAIWAYVKENNLQNPKDKRKIIVDDKLATIFTPPITMFNMNKQLSNHVFSKGSVAGGSDDGEPSAAKPRPAKRAKKRRGSDDDDDGGSSRKGTGFAKPLPLSDELAAACGKTEMSRGELSKWIFAYAEEQGLKDPSDKRYANCDETLERLTGQKRIMLFGAGKWFKEHLLT